ncbi:hypothetical protein M5K25_016374 [Dendrobium thyrsiflorum]|uniref:Uncharacterized protein n=1 Tax=Dendrobium thyrsiflorum TaxID=117978 RepID=A0ABD0UKD7_DENTH
MRNILRRHEYTSACKQAVWCVRVPPTHHLASIKIRVMKFEQKFWEEMRPGFWGFYQNSVQSVQAYDGRPFIHGVADVRYMDFIPQEVRFYAAAVVWLHLLRLSNDSSFFLALPFIQTDPYGSFWHVESSKAGAASPVEVLEVPSYMPTVLELVPIAGTSFLESCSIDLEGSTLANFGNEQKGDGELRQWTAVNGLEARSEATFSNELRRTGARTAVNVYDGLVAMGTFGGLIYEWQTEMKRKEKGEE